MASIGLHDQRYRSAKDQFLGVCKQANTPCWLCGKDIDYKAQPQQPLAFELDHARPLSTHPELAYDEGNFRASHSKCNRARQDAPMPVSARGNCWVAADW